MAFYSFAKQLIKVFSSLGARSSQILLFTAVVIIFYDVVMRYLFNSPSSWVLEISEYILVFIVVAGAANVQKKKMHIKMDFFYNKFGVNIRCYLDLIFYMVTVIFAFLIFMTSLQMTLTAYYYGSRSNSLIGTAMFIPYSIVPFAMFIFLMQSVVDLVESIKDIIKRSFMKGQNL